MSRVELEQFANNLWILFIQQLDRETFSEPERIIGGKHVKNLLGSIEKHKKVFDRAIEEYFEEKDFFSR